MSTVLARRRGIARLAAVALALGAIGAIDTAVHAPDASAAGCSFSNLTSKSVKNVDCRLGAYGYKSSASSSSGTQVGAWVFPGSWSANPKQVCYQFPTMVHP